MSILFIAYIFRKPISYDPKENQMQMIRMFRELLNDPNFVPEFKEELLGKSNKTWKLSDKRTLMCAKMKPQAIIDKIHEVLDRWELYGYWFLLGMENALTLKKEKEGLAKKNEKVNHIVMQIV
jgi:hypothetical protein